MNQSGICPVTAASNTARSELVGLFPVVLKQEDQ